MVRPCLVVCSLFGMLVWMSEDVHVGAQNVNTVTPGNECITSCMTSNGRLLPDGSYPFCDDCGVLSSCSGGFLTTQKCPLGTNYYDRVSKVCVTDPSVCVKDNPSSGTPPTQVTASTASSQPVTAISSDRPVVSTFDVTASTTRTDTVGSTAAPTTNTVSITPETVVPITSTISTTTETAEPTTNTVLITTETAIPTTNAGFTITGVVTNSTSSSSAETAANISPPSTELTPQTFPTSPVSSSSLSTTGAPLSGSSTTTSATPASTTYPSVSSTPVPGYIPESGAESESFLFALDRYNLYSQSRMRAGPLAVNIFNKQPLDSSTQGKASDMWYRFFGVTMVPSRCRNTAENMGANSTQCPLDPAAMSSVQLVTCDFKVHYSPGATGERLALTFFMCF